VGILEQTLPSKEERVKGLISNDGVEGNIRLPDIKSALHWVIFNGGSAHANATSMGPQICQAILAQLIIKIEQAVQDLLVLLEPSMLQGIVGSWPHSWIWGE
jgi:hypothetical protein